MTAARTGSRLRVGACLSLTGQYARFGTQAAEALRVWAVWHGGVELVIEDDESAPATLERVLPQVAARADVLLGPYSTQLARAAGRIAAEDDWLVWNHGGSGDDVETAHPGHLVSILTPTSRYADPFLHHLADIGDGGQLWLVRSRGSFGRQVTSGAAQLAEQLGIPDVQVVTAEQFTDTQPTGDWALFSVGRFEDDITTVTMAQNLDNPPTMICAVAAGVYEFRDHIPHPDGIFGIAQWFPGNPGTPHLGPTEVEFLHAYTARTGFPPDYPAVQAVAAAVVAEHCVTTAHSISRADLWAVATSLETSTLFGGFKIDPETGAQHKHTTALLRWGEDQPRLYR